MLAFCCEQCGNNRTTSDQEACHPGPGGGIHKLCATPLRARARARRPPSLRAKRRDCPSRPTALLPPLVGKSTYRQLLDDDSRRVGRSQSGQPQKPARQPAGQRPNEPDPVGRLLLPLRPRHSPSQPVLRSLMMRATRRGREQRPRRAMTGGGPQKQSQRGQKERGRARARAHPGPPRLLPRAACICPAIAGVELIPCTHLLACLSLAPPGLHSGKDRQGNLADRDALPPRVPGPDPTARSQCGRWSRALARFSLAIPKPPATLGQGAPRLFDTVARPKQDPFQPFLFSTGARGSAMRPVGAWEKIVEIKNVGFDVVVLLSSMP